MRSNMARPYHNKPNRVGRDLQAFIGYLLICLGIAFFIAGCVRIATLTIEPYTIIILLVSFFMILFGWLILPGRGRI